MRIMLMQPGFADIYGHYKHIYRKGFSNMPLSHCYLAASANAAGHDVTIVDAEGESLLINQVLERARQFRPDLFGMTATSIDFLPAVTLAKALKIHFPDIPIMLGGTHINIYQESVLKEIDCFDYGCVGDGEELIAELAAVLEIGDRNKLNNIPGLIFRSDQTVIRNKDRILVQDIDQYFFPKRDVINNDLYIRSVPFQGVKATASFISGRGCPFSCIYCAIDKIANANKVRLRSASNVLDELEIIVNTIGIKHVAFNDDVLTVNKKRVHAICEGILERNLKFTWEGLTRADLVDRELLTAMRKAGLIRMSFGIESGNQKILDILQKNEKKEEIAEAINTAHDVGIVTQGSVILGAPLETRATVRQTVKFIKSLKLDQAVINIMQPYPGTKVREMFRRGECGGRLITNLEDSASSTFDSKLQRFGNAMIAVNDLAPNDLIKLQKIAYLTFYVRPKMILRSIQINGFRQFANQGFNFARAVFQV